MSSCWQLLWQHCTKTLAGTMSSRDVAERLIHDVSCLLQVAQLAEAAQAWQRRAQKLEQQLQASEEQQRSQLAGASAQYAAQLQVCGHLMHSMQLLIACLLPSGQP